MRPREIVMRLNQCWGTLLFLGCVAEVFCVALPAMTRDSAYLVVSGVRLLVRRV
jgi:hypothetical protein